MAEDKNLSGPDLNSPGDNSPDRTAISFQASISGIIDLLRRFIIEKPTTVCCMGFETEFKIR